MKYLGPQSLGHPEAFIDLRNNRREGLAACHALQAGEIQGAAHGYRFSQRKAGILG